ncbi:Glucosaminyl phosphatidylinositol (GlcN-PI) nositol acylation protein [Elasticomyces elasticus]|nr:Glucosaminyl phosphatidylinositol (GlcN-PI) nositol acylation protein [Elasticomyces elasticus]
MDPVPKAVAGNYKAMKEAFVSDLHGGSHWEINAITLVAPAAALLWASLQARQAFFRPYTPLAYLTDFLIHCGAILFATTAYADNPLVLNGLLILPGIAAFTNLSAPQPRRGPKLSKTEKTSEEVDGSERRDGQDELPTKPFVTTYRGMMMIITCTSILAVDFHVFPRRFAKVENWGTSLMDMGVGSFVFSAGLVSAKAVLKDRMTTERYGKSKSFVTRFVEAVRHSIALFALGVIRLWAVKGLDYAEHVTEYGVHWNFFFTLALIPPAVALLRPLLDRVFSQGGFALIIAVAYEAVLTYSDLSRYIITAPRVDFLSKNREGIFSFIGYFAIFLVGQGMGLNVLRRDPESLAKVKTQEDVWIASMLGGEDAEKKVLRDLRPRDSALFSLAKWTAIWSLMFLGPYRFRSLATLVSRRLANLPYVLWVCAFNCAQLTLFCGIEKLFFPNLYTPKDKQTERERCEEATSKVLRAFNRNGLAVFLLANLLTGAVNLALPTLNMGDVEAMAVLVGYTATLCGAALALDHYDVSIKL